MPARSSSGDTRTAGAEEFLATFAAERATNDLESRLARMRGDMAATGTWQPAFEELEHGARMAWRNNARCIGRLFWPSLKVRDLRHLDDPDGIAVALGEHLDLATNGGKIIPLITVFAPSDREGPRVRIWNHQLLGYAGYRQADGVILGDPKNEAFTRQAMALGWKGAGTAFDLLPWIVQKRGSPPRLYPPPSGRCLEVFLSHPREPCFAERGWRWYAVPVLADMCLRIGGVDFPAAPFNGWYLGTEIGSRDLGDTGRYDLLPAVAEMFGFSSDPLWKDRALVELNAAVLHSFEQAGVRIVDHHRASSEFMEFAAREAKAGRAVSGDWSWIVPPLSGSATPVFHKLWQNRHLLPDYLLQKPAWEDFHAAPFAPA